LRHTEACVSPMYAGAPQREGSDVLNTSRQIMNDIFMAESSCARPVDVSAAAVRHSITLKRQNGRRAFSVTH